jgi:hypothetical protein
MRLIIAVVVFISMITAVLAECQTTCYTDSTGQQHCRQSCSGWTGSGGWGYPR